MIISAVEARRGWPRLWVPLMGVAVVGILFNYPTVIYHLYPGVAAVATWFLVNLVVLARSPSAARGGRLPCLSRPGWPGSRWCWPHSRC